MLTTSLPLWSCLAHSQFSTLKRTSAGTPGEIPNFVLPFFFVPISAIGILSGFGINIKAAWQVLFSAFFFSDEHTPLTPLNVLKRIEKYNYLFLRLYFLRTFPLLEISLARYSNGTLFWLVWKAMPRSRFSWWTSRLKPLWVTSISRISNSLFSIFDFFRNRKSSKWNKNGRRTFRTKWDRNEAPWLVNKDDSSKIIFSKQSFTNYIELEWIITNNLDKPTE